MTARMTPARLVGWTIVIGTLLRLALDAAVGYGIGEAYYVASARHLALSYFDQPPLSLWVTWAMLQAVDAGNALLMRLPFVAMFAVSTWLMYRLGARLFGAWAGAWAAVLLNLSFVFSVSVASWVQPDAPLFMFLLAAAVAVAELAFGRPAQPMRWWVAAGALFGLALLSKYHAALTIAGLLLFAATTPGYRVWFFNRGPLAAAAVAVLTFAPVAVWNEQYHWVSFAFQGARVEGDGIHFDWLVRSIVGQGLLIGVFIWPPMIWVFCRALLRGPRDANAWFLCCLAIIPVVFFTAAATWADFGLHLHWQATGYVFLFPLLGKAVADGTGQGSRVARWWLAASAVLLVALAVAIGSEVRLGWLKLALPLELRAWAEGPDNPANELVGWTGLGDALAAKGALPAEKTFAVAVTWTEAGKLDTEVGGAIPIVCFCDDPRNIAFVHDPQAFAGWDALIVTSNGRIDIPARYGAYFSEIAPLTTVEVQPGASLVHTLRVFRARGYTGAYPLPYP